MNQTPSSSPGLDRYTVPADGLPRTPAGGPGQRPRQQVEARIAEAIRQFNDDVQFALANLASKVGASREGLLGKNAGGALPASAEAVLDRYAVVDALAVYYRDKTWRTFRALLGLAFGAMILLEAFAHGIFQLESLVEEDGSFHMQHLVEGAGWLPRLFLLYPAVWLVAYATWYWAHRHEYQRKHQDYRALAEGLRVQFFWNLLGLADAVEDHYLRWQRGELEWIRQALRSWRGFDDRTPGHPPLSRQQLKDHKELVRQRWVRGQLEYFTTVAGQREQRQDRRCKRWSTILFCTSLAAALVLGMLFFLSEHQGIQGWRALGFKIAEEFLIFGIGVLLVGAALWVAYGEKMAFAEHARHYEAMGVCFQDINDQLSEGDLTDADRELFLELGKEALAENGDWLLLHRDRPLEVIVP